MKKTLTLLCFLLIVVSCNKSNPLVFEDENNFPFFPLQIGNYWNYFSKNFKVAYKLRISDKVIINDQVWYEARRTWYWNNDSALDEEHYYFREDGSQLFRFSCNIKAKEEMDLDKITPFLDTNMNERDVYKYTHRYFKYINNDLNGFYDSIHTVRVMKRTSNSIEQFYDLPGSADDEFYFVFTKGIGVTNESTVWLGSLDLINSNWNF